MKALAKEIAAGLAFLAIGLAVALVVVFVQGVEASPDPGVSYVLRGMSPLAGQQCYDWEHDPEPYWRQFHIDGWQSCWHLTEPGYPAIDYSRTDGQTAGSLVYLDYVGDFQLFKMLALPDSYACKGVRAGIYWGSYDDWNYKGDVHYLHIDVNEWVIDDEVPWQLYWIGDVAEEENLGCLWFGAHLHQSADWSAITPFYSNKLADPSEGQNWQHAIMWEAGSGDEDGDDFTNANELYINTDPFDDCADTVTANDEYPDPWPVDFNDDTWCNIVDVVLFKPYIMCFIGDECYDNRFDLDADGDVDISDVLKLKPYIVTSCA